MRYVILAIATLLAGTTIGVGTTIREFENITERFSPFSDGTETRLSDLADNEKAPQVVDPIPGGKVLVENGETHNFGQMERRGTLTHEFLFRNAGTAKLHLRENGTSCTTCTISTFTEATLEPGESVGVKVQWSAKQMESDFRKEAYIATSDPDRPLVRLIIEGKVVTSLRILPTELTFNSQPTSTSASGRINVFNFQEQPLEVSDIRLENQELAEFFEIEVKPITEQEMLDKAQAKGGVAFLITMKPGLPLGSFQQTIRFQTNLPGGASQEIPIRGFVTSDISFVGPGFDSRHQELNLGTVKRGSKATLIALIRGPHREATKFSVSSVDPANSLRVSVTEPEPFGEGAFRINVIFEVPEDAAAVSLLGGAERENYGKLVLDTTHPDVQHVPIYIRFAVE